MNYENDDELIRKINERNDKIIALEKNSFDDFQEYKKNESILNELRVKRILEREVQENKVKVVKKENKNIFFVYWIVSFSIIFIFSIMMGFFLYSQNKRENFKKEEIQKEKIIQQEKELNEFRKSNILKLEKENFEKELKAKEIVKEQGEIEKVVKKVMIVSMESRGNKLGYFYAYENNILVKEGQISSGRDHYESPVGKFPVLEKKRYSTSNIYASPNGINNMDYMIRLTWGGIALHMGNPNQISHGCVHISSKDAPWVFNWTDYKTDVYLTTQNFNKNISLKENISNIDIVNKKINSKRNKIRTEEEFWPNGNYKTIKRYLGKYLHGVQRSYWENGFIKEEKFYKTGRWNGKRIEYWNNGQKLREFIWKNDELQMGKSWDRNGNLLMDFDIRDKKD